MEENVHGLVFSREDGKPITKDASTGTLKRACRDAKVKSFRFHDLRHCAKTAWARRGIPAETAMLAAGHSSFQMHQRYIHLQRSDVAKPFGILQHGCNTDFPAKDTGSSIREIIIGGVGERLKPPVLKTGVHFVDREFESRPLRHFSYIKA